MGCCLTLILIAIISERVRRRSANRAQSVVLACATFDPDGNLMVTFDGHFPCRKITNSYIEKVRNARAPKDTILMALRSHLMTFSVSPMMLSVGSFGHRAAGMELRI